MTHNLITLRTWGDFACFSRPELPVERVSYPILTPSAARGILEAVFWHPEFYYLVDAIRIVRKGYWISFVRAEVTQTIPFSQITTWMQDPSQVRYIEARVGVHDSTQRNTLALADVEYVITAELRLTQLATPQHALAGYRHTFQQRAERGQCFHRPALGMREFAADFAWEDDAQEALERRSATLGTDWRAYNDEVGVMLYDIFSPEERVHGFRPRGPGRPAEGTVPRRQARFFRASIRGSTMQCHPEHVQLI